jgi:2-polyprenyl-6-methoxyphenol hydroxylase-like FAD-dependent oxidoreductase
MGENAAVPAHAVVIGASIAGLLAASVLAETFPRVTVFDRDTLPSEPEPRRGVPQSRQLHAMHARGAQALTELLPGFWDEMVAAGAPVGDTQAEVHWYLDDYLLKPAPSGLKGIAITRPRLEWLMRSRVAALPAVRITDATDVTGLVTSGGRVTGVTVSAARTPDAVPETVAADLVIDATGRGSRALTWLGELGYPVPRSSELRADVTYLSRFYSRDPAQLDGRFGGLVTPYPGQPRGGAVLRQEGDRFVVLLAGMIGEEPPLDEAGMLAYADSLACPDIAAVMRQSTPLGEPVRFTYPSSTLHHYHELDAYLGGFLLIGDALCGLNPIYGQGITVAALEALTLRRMLGPGGGAGSIGVAVPAADLPRTYFREVGKLLAEAWATAAAADLRFPQVAGNRQPGSSLINAYMVKYRAAASVDPVLGRTFLRVANMIDKPTRLLSAGHVFRVFRSAGKATRAVPATRVTG